MDTPIILEDLLLDEAPDADESDELAPDQEAETIEEKLLNENITPPTKLNYKLKTIDERRDLVESIIAQTPAANLTNRYLEILGDYIMGAISKEEKKEHLYLTDNRLITINKREMSFEGLAEKFENGEDGIYNLMTNDKNIIFSHKLEITAEDEERVPGLRALREAIRDIEAAAKAATGRKKYLLKKQLIEMRRDQYVLKNSYQAPMGLAPTAHGANKIDLSERRYIDANGEPQSTGLISLFNPEHISALMTHYHALRIETKGHYHDDFFYLLEDFDKLFHRALDGYPHLLTIATMKMDGKTNTEIQQVLKKDFNIDHTVQYISSLWRNKIPKLIAEQEQNDYILWYYQNEQKGEWKRCSCCKQYKLANTRFFSRNSTSKDGLYSICKSCRSKKMKKI